MDNSLLSEDPKQRNFIDLTNFPCSIKKEIHDELTGNNPGEYCATHHSIETRTTKKNHINCITVKASEVQGKLNF